MGWRGLSGLGICPSSTFTVASSSFPEESGWEACTLADSLTYLCSQVHVSPFPEFSKPSAVRFGDTDLPPHVLQYGQEFLQRDQHWGVLYLLLHYFLPVNILILLSCIPLFVFPTNSSSRRKSVYNMSCQVSLGIIRKLCCYVLRACIFQDTQIHNVCIFNTYLHL